MDFPFLNRARWVTDKYILAMLGLFPLYVGFQGYHAITEAKLAFCAWATGLWAAAVLVMILCGLIAGERYRLDIRPAHMAVGLFLAVSALSAMASEYGGKCLVGAARYNGYLTTLLYGAVFFGVSQLGTPRRRYVWAMGLSAAVCCAIAFLQLMGLDPFWFYPEGTDYYDKYVAYNSAFLGTIGNTGLLAAYLCLAAPLTAVYGALSRHRSDRLLFIPAGMSLVTLALCDVDAGVLAMAGCALAAAPIAIRDRRAARVAGGISGGLVAGGLAGLWFWPGKSGTLYEMHQVLHGHMADEFGSHRGQIWKRCWELFKQQPWLGGGPGTGALRFDIQWYSDVRQAASSVDNAHNVYLGYLVDIGVFGAAAYVAAVGLSLITWIKRRRKDALYPAVGAAFFAYAIQDFFGLGLILTEPMFWLIWGLLESRPEAREAMGGQLEQDESIADRVL